MYINSALKLQEALSAKSEKRSPQVIYYGDGSSKTYLYYDKVTAKKFHAKPDVFISDYPDTVFLFGDNIPTFSKFIQQLKKDHGENWFNIYKNLNVETGTYTQGGGGQAASMLKNNGTGSTYVSNVFSVPICDPKTGTSKEVKAYIDLMCNFLKLQILAGRDVVIPCDAFGNPNIGTALAHNRMGEDEEGVKDYLRSQLQGVEAFAHDVEKGIIEHDKIHDLSNHLSKQVQQQTDALLVTQVSTFQQTKEKKLPTFQEPMQAYMYSSDEDDEPEEYMTPMTGLSDRENARVFTASESTQFNVQTADNKKVGMPAYGLLGKNTKLVSAVARGTTQIGSDARHVTIISAVQRLLTDAVVEGMPLNDLARLMYFHTEVLIDDICEGTGKSKIEIAKDDIISALKSVYNPTSATPQVKQIEFLGKIIFSLHSKREFVSLPEEGNTKVLENEGATARNTLRDLRAFDKKVEANFEQEIYLTDVEINKIAESFYIVFDYRKLDPEKVVDYDKAIIKKAKKQKDIPDVIQERNSELMKEFKEKKSGYNQAVKSHWRYVGEPLERLYIVTARHLAIMFAYCPSIQSQYQSQIFNAFIQKVAENHGIDATVLGQEVLERLYKIDVSSMEFQLTGVQRIDCEFYYNCEAFKLLLKDHPAYEGQYNELVEKYSKATVDAKQDISNELSELYDQALNEHSIHIQCLSHIEFCKTLIETFPVYKEQLDLLVESFDKCEDVDDKLEIQEKLDLLSESMETEQELLESYNVNMQLVNHQIEHFPDEVDNFLKLSLAFQTCSDLVEKANITVEMKNMYIKMYNTLDNDQKATEVQQLLPFYKEEYLDKHEVLSSLLKAYFLEPLAENKLNILFQINDIHLNTLNDITPNLDPDLDLDHEIKFLSRQCKAHIQEMLDDKETLVSHEYLEQLIKGANSEDKNQVLASLKEIVKVYDSYYETNDDPELYDDEPELYSDDQELSDDDQGLYDDEQELSDDDQGLYDDEQELFDDDQGLYDDEQELYDDDQPYYSQDEQEHPQTSIESTQRLEQMQNQQQILKRKQVELVQRHQEGNDEPHESQVSKKQKSTHETPKKIQ